MIQNNRIPWVAFYTDVKHKVEVVKSGMRMTLQFDLIAQKTAPEDEDGIKRRLQGGRYFSDPVKYRFHDYNEEGLEAIKNKVAMTLGQEIKQVKEKEERKKEEKSKKSDTVAMKKRDRPDNDEPLKIETTKHMKVEYSQSDQEEDQDESEQFEKKLNISNSDEVSYPDGVAILLKRRYGAITLSLDRLKGIDEVLYRVLKDDFRLEVKHIVLEQNTDYEGKYKDERIQIVALGQIGETEDTCSSEEEEVGLKPNKKKVPSRPDEERNKVKVNSEKEKTKKEKEEDKVKAKKVFLVSGFSPKSVMKLVSEDYVECTGNESQSGVYAYMHAALFVYPKG